MYEHELQSFNRWDILKVTPVRPKNSATQVVAIKSSGSWYLSGVGVVDGYGRLMDPIPSPDEDVRQETNAETVDDHGYPPVALQPDKAVAAYRGQYVLDSCASDQLLMISSQQRRRHRGGLPNAPRVLEHLPLESCDLCDKKSTHS